MVNAYRIKRKLPSLLCDGSRTDKKQWNQHNIIAYRLQRFKRQNPEKFGNLYNELVAVLEEFEKAVFANTTKALAIYRLVTCSAFKEIDSVYD